jgi:DNA-binding response OmpR family regulator
MAAILAMRWFMVKKTILVVDDDKTILRMFKHILQKNDYEIDTAETGKEAMAKVGNRQYDLVMLDLWLPDMDGTDLLIKAKKQIANAVKIVITGFPSLETGVKSLEEGADAYLVKPVRGEELLAVVKDKLSQEYLSKNMSGVDFFYD